MHTHGTRMLTFTQCIHWTYAVHIFKLCTTYVFNVYAMYTFSVYITTGKGISICVTGSLIGIRNSRDGSCMAVSDDRRGCWQLRMWVSATLLCMHKVFPAWRGKQTIVTSLVDVTVIMLTWRVGSCTRGVCMSRGALVWVFGCSTFGSNQLEATDPFLWLLQCLSRSGTITRKGSVHYLFNCKCSRLSRVPWVSLL